MGYYHIMISDVCAPAKDKLPEWFKEKYKSTIDFSGEYWRTFSEYKRYSVLRDIEEDTQKLMQEIDGFNCLNYVFFADEGYLDVSHVHITPNDITEINIQD